MSEDSKESQPMTNDCRMKTNIYITRITGYNIFQGCSQFEQANELNSTPSEQDEEENSENYDLDMDTNYGEEDFSIGDNNSESVDSEEKSDNKDQKEPEENSNNTEIDPSEEGFNSYLDERRACIEYHFQSDETEYNSGKDTRNTDIEVARQGAQLSVTTLLRNVTKGYKWATLKRDVSHVPELKNIQDEVDSSEQIEQNMRMSMANLVVTPEEKNKIMEAFNCKTEEEYLNALNYTNIIGGDLHDRILFNLNPKNYENADDDVVYATKQLTVSSRDNEKYLPHTNEDYNFDEEDDKNWKCRVDRKLGKLFEILGDTLQFRIPGVSPKTAVTAVTLHEIYEKIPRGLYNELNGNTSLPLAFQHFKQLYKGTVPEPDDSSDGTTCTKKLHRTGSIYNDKIDELILNKSHDEDEEYTSEDEDDGILNVYIPKEVVSVRTLLYPHKLENDSVGDPKADPKIGCLDYKMGVASRFPEGAPQIPENKDMKEYYLGIRFPMTEEMLEADIQETAQQSEAIHQERQYCKHVFDLVAKGYGHVQSLFPAYLLTEASPRYESQRGIITFSDDEESVIFVRNHSEDWYHRIFFDFVPSQKMVNQFKQELCNKYGENFLEKNKDDSFIYKFISGSPISLQMEVNDPLAVHLSRIGVAGNVKDAEGNVSCSVHNIGIRSCKGNFKANKEHCSTNIDPDSKNFTREIAVLQTFLDFYHIEDIMTNYNVLVKGDKIKLGEAFLDKTEKFKEDISEINEQEETNIEDTVETFFGEPFRKELTSQNLSDLKAKIINTTKSLTAYCEEKKKESPDIFEESFEGPRIVQSDSKENNRIEESKSLDIETISSPDSPIATISDTISSDNDMNEGHNPPSKKIEWIQLNIRGLKLQLKQLQEECTGLLDKKKKIDESSTGTIDTDIHTGLEILHAMSSNIEQQKKITTQLENLQRDCDKLVQLQNQIDTLYSECEKICPCINTNNSSVQISSPDDNKPVVDQPVIDSINVPKSKVNVQNLEKDIINYSSTPSGVNTVLNDFNYTRSNKI